MKDTVVVEKALLAAEIVLRGRSSRIRVPKERNKIKQNCAMDNIGDVSVRPEGFGTVDTNLPRKNPPVSSNVTAVSEKQCVGGRNRSPGENGFSKNAVSTKGTELWELLPSSKLNIYDLVGN